LGYGVTWVMCYGSCGLWIRVTFLRRHNKVKSKEHDTIYSHQREVERERIKQCGKSDENIRRDRGDKQTTNQDDQRNEERQRERKDEKKL
jgi:hypothetical protein